jgi:MFS family permease
MSISAPSARHLGFVAAMVIDSVAAGVYLPAAVIFLLSMTNLGLAAIGTALTVAGLAALPVGLWAGRIVDEIGPRPVLMVSNVAQAMGILGYLALHSFWGVVLCSLVASAGRGVFFGALGVAVTTIALPGERERWFARIGSVRNLGQAAGALAAGAVLAVGTHAAFEALAVLTAAAFLGAIPLMSGVSRPTRSEQAPHTQSWASAWRDRPYRLVLAQWATFMFSVQVLGLAIPPYATVVLGLPRWLGAASFVLNTLIIGFGQSALIRRLDGRVRSRVMVGGHVGFALGFALLLIASLTHGALAISIVLLGVAVYTLGETIGWPVNATVSAEAAPEELRGRYLALTQLVNGAVGAIAPSVFAGLLTMGAAATWLPMMGICALGIGLASTAGRALPAAAALIGDAAASELAPEHVDARASVEE